MRRVLFGSILAPMLACSALMFVALPSEPSAAASPRHESIEMVGRGRHVDTHTAEPSRRSAREVIRTVAFLAIPLAFARLLVGWRRESDSFTKIVSRLELPSRSRAPPVLVFA